jgi:hypothetical protein
MAELSFEALTDKRCTQANLSAVQHVLSPHFQAIGFLRRNHHSADTWHIGRRNSYFRRGFKILTTDDARNLLDFDPELVVRCLSSGLRPLFSTRVHHLSANEVQFILLHVTAPTAILKRSKNGRCQVSKTATFWRTARTASSIVAQRYTANRERAVSVRPIACFAISSSGMRK